MPDLFTPTSLEPYRPPSLQQRISAAIDGFRKGNPSAAIATPNVKVEPEAPPQTKTTDDPAGRALPDANYISPSSRQWQELFFLNGARQARYKDYADMDVSYGEAMLDAFVDACLVSDDGKFQSFQVQAKGKIQNVLDGLIESTNLTFFIRDVLRDVAKYGDNFIGYIWDSQFNIVDLDNPPPEQMFVFVDEHNRVLSGSELVNGQSVAKGYQQKNAALTTVAAWHPFEMLHLKWKPSKRLIYSQRSFFEGFRADWLKIKLIEESIVMHRVTRAAPRLAHMIDVTGKNNDEAKAAIEGYINDLRSRKLADGSTAQHMMSVDEDYVMSQTYRANAGDGKLYPALNDVKFLDPRNTGLQSLADLDYLRKKLFSRIPSEIVGVLSDREDISTQDIAASRLYSFAQYLLEHQFLRPLFDTQLLLRGFRPEKGDYELIFPNVQLRSSWRFADAQFRQSLADANDVEVGINNRKKIAQDKFGWTDAEWDAHVEQYKKEKDVFAPPEPQQPAKKSPNKSNAGNAGKASKVTQMRKGNNST